MPRAMWSGIIGFGMVSIPVKLYTATESKTVAFHQLHDECKTRLKEFSWCPNCEKEVEWEHVEKGYEYSKGEYITLTDEDFEKLPLPSKNLINVNAFVNGSEIDPLFFEKSYYLEPTEAAAHAFGLFMQALEGKSMIAIGTITLRNKERPCALRPGGGTILMSTLLYPNEIRVDLNAKRPEAKVSKQELNMAYSLVDLLAQKFEPDQFEDHYRAALMKLIDAKLEGLPAEEKPSRAGRGKVVDLMDALQQSIDKVKSKDTSSKNNGAEKSKSRSTSKSKASSSSSRSRASKSKKPKRSRGAA